MTGPAPMEVVERILTETGVDRTVPPPGWLGYLQALAEAFAAWLHRSLPSLPGLASVVTALGPIATVVVALVVVTILSVLVRMAILSRRHRRAALFETGPLPSPPPAAQDRDRAAWRGELERRLAAGDVAGSLEALWWWFARSVSAAGVDPAWTSQELLSRCRRGDLAPFARTLDRLLYGPERPRLDELRVFLGRVEGALP